MLQEIERLEADLAQLQEQLQAAQQSRRAPLLLSELNAAGTAGVAMQNSIATATPAPSLRDHLLVDRVCELHGGARRSHYYSQLNWH